ncbi:MAG: bifunctional folylpolyglutamate synthase/dihydrofolate synthase [Candidatus Eisenbacteria bacterium]|uniref:tetrahydrofolate synthase n=1 Tax=Eiseniibacteriota bacterium TaxID=2212470 RepID=A0A948WB63_UNCEI|nr:bifunctional folylpolyglutamate synthase/dihydrofolate synthase [Candidatus Eisenbacteria bacterium]MBU1949278.1 bifunctional folylpolyglutamate synthase/dihydrofolate synthase [Candidatus Eisenbacteria bacterium]MBU2689678.1 bifunctional folylpolyglutamate synthase/dihydrofolate synthase [Candidatus Eisenbacteria bacterium]
MTYDEALDRLYTLEHSGIKLGLSRIQSALRDLGSPQNAFASVHIAGTNGKGSTSAMMAGVLRSCGLRTGLYTSPHIRDFRERIRIDGRMAAPGWIIEGLETIWPAVERNSLSFFEAATCLAFWIFVQQGVRIAVLEVGLGGRLDATNVVTPQLAIITSLSIDHQKTLGASLAEIAGEKAGILKPGVELILAGCPKEARDTVLSVALERGVPVQLDREALAVRDLQLHPRSTQWRSIRKGEDLPAWLDGCWEIPMAGAHQVENARMVLLGAALLQKQGWPLTEAGIRTGLRSTHWPGRLEVLLPQYPILLDVAHNPEGGRRLVRALNRWPELGKARWIVGMVKGKDHKNFLHQLSRAGGRFHFCSPEHPRCVPTEVLAEAAEGLNYTMHPSVEDALNCALEERGDDEICVVSGSFFTMDEACRALGIGPRESLQESVEVTL